MTITRSPEEISTESIAAVERALADIGTDRRTKPVTPTPPESMDQVHDFERPFFAKIVEAR